MLMRPQCLVLVALSLAAACAPTAGAPAAATAADSAAVNSLRDQEVAAIGTNDTTLAYMADDIVLMPPNEAAVVGKAAARAWFVGITRMFRATVAYGASTVVFSGDLAVEQYSATLTLTPVAGGDTVTEALKGIHIFRRDATGTWKMAHDIWNSDTPVAPPAPAPVQ